MYLGVAQLVEHGAEYRPSLTPKLARHERQSRWVAESMAFAEANRDCKHERNMEENAEVASSNLASWTLFRKDELGSPQCPYIRRWILDLGLFSLRVHHWLADDDQRADHDHPWWFLTLVIKGSYIDVTHHDFVRVPNSDVCHAVLPGVAGLLCYQREQDHPFPSHETLGPGSIRYRPAHYQHTVRTKGCWTVLITGKKERNFGFWVARKSDGVRRFIKANKFFATNGPPPCS